MTPCLGANVIRGRATADRARRCGILPRAVFGQREAGMDGRYSHVRELDEGREAGPHAVDTKKRGIFRRTLSRSLFHHRGRSKSLQLSLEDPPFAAVEGTPYADRANALSVLALPSWSRRLPVSRIEEISSWNSATS